ncbi:MAG: segregation and condensation protein A [Candidatus Limivicinus sp.]
MENPSFFLEGVVKEKNELQDFEGPLSLILMLLSKNKIEIRDIKISEILDQYLEYLAQMQSMDLEIASEFVQMASHLLYIKTKTLLTSDDEEVSELEVLMASLEQLKCKDVYNAVRQVTPELKQASELGLLYFSKLPEPLPKTTKEYEYRHEPVDLLKALASVYMRGGKTPELESFSSAVPKRIVYSIRDKSRQILSRLSGGSVTLKGLYAECHSRSEVVATFMSVLELCSMGNIHISRSGDDYMVEFTGGDVDEIIEKIVE